MEKYSPLPASLGTGVAAQPSRGSRVGQSGERRRRAGSEWAGREREEDIGAWGIYVYLYIHRRERAVVISKMIAHTNTQEKTEKENKCMLILV